VETEEAEGEEEAEVVEAETEQADGQEEVVGFPDGEEEKDTKIVFSLGGQPKPPAPRSVSQKFLANINTAGAKRGRGGLVGVKRKDPEVHVTLKGAPKMTTSVVPPAKNKIVVKKRR